MLSFDSLSINYSIAEGGKTYKQNENLAVLVKIEFSIIKRQHCNDELFTLVPKKL